MNVLKRVVGILIILMVIESCKSNNNQLENLDSTIKKHFTAIKNRDTENLLKTEEFNSEDNALSVKLLESLESRKRIFSFRIVIFGLCLTLLYKISCVF